MKFPRVPLHLQIVGAMALGVIAGQLLGRSAAPLGEFGRVVIQLIKALAAPLLFLAIVNAFMEMSVRARSAAWMVGISAVNGCLALAIGLFISNTFEPGRHLAVLVPEDAAPATLKAEALDPVKSLAGHIPESLVKPFNDNAIISIIIVAVLMGLALRRVKDRQTAAGRESFRVVEDGVHTLLDAVQVALGWVIALIPPAIFGVVARSVGENGLSMFKSLGIYLLAGLGGLLLHVILVYHTWLFLAARMSLRRFWAAGRDAVLYCMGTSSSLATLPVTLRSLDRMGVSAESARMAACVGTNLNNDGILLYEAMAVLMVAQAHGVDLPVSQQLLAAFACVVAGVGIAGVPEAGLISLAVVLATVGLPMEILPLLLTVDWVLSRARAATNVTSDMLVGVLLDRFSPPLAEREPVGGDRPEAGAPGR